MNSHDTVQGAGETFFASAVYRDWVGQGSRTLICPGQGMLGF